jgi:hypothetical protein
VSSGNSRGKEFMNWQRRDGHGLHRFCQAAGGFLKEEKGKDVLPGSGALQSACRYAYDMTV